MVWRFLNANGDRRRDRRKEAENAVVIIITNLRQNKRGATFLSASILRKTPKKGRDAVRIGEDATVSEVGETGTIA